MASILWVPITFTCVSCLLYWMSVNLPEVDSSLGVNSTALKFPSDLQELTALAALLSHYKQHHWNYVFALFCLAYLFKQSYAIPGSIFLNLLGGALFGLSFGFPLTCFLSAAGATGCYLLSQFCGKDYVIKYFPDRIAPLQHKVKENRDSLLFFLLFLRLFPMAPNWFMNISAPIVDVPIHMFFMSVFLGLMPYNFICVQTGCILSEVKSMDSIFNLWTCLKLFAMATAALVPGVLLKHYQAKRISVTAEKTAHQGGIEERSVNGVKN